MHRDTLLETPWRTTINWSNSLQELAVLKDKCENYKPLMQFSTRNIDFPKVNILLLGGVGCGKSSVFNTINSCFRGKIFNVAMSGATEHRLTSKFRKYPVLSRKSTLPAPLKFCICDLPGIEMDHLMTKENMCYLLEGNIADRFPFDPKGKITSDMSGFKRSPSLHDKIHCVAIVQDATIIGSVEELCPEITNNIKDMQTVMDELGIPQVVILTRIEYICEKVHDDLANVLRSQAVERCVSLAAEVFGLPKNVVYPIKNYEEECKLNTKIDILSLLALTGMLDNCDTYLLQHHDEIVEKYPDTIK